MPIMKHNLSITDVWNTIDELYSDGDLNFGFAGVVLSNRDGQLYRLAANTLPTRINSTSIVFQLAGLEDGDPWEVTLPQPGTDTRHAILAVPGSIIDDNIWTFWMPGEEPDLDACVSAVDPLPLWPDWVAEQRELIRFGQSFPNMGTVLENSPTLPDVMRAWNAFQIVHGAANAYLIGGFISLENEQERYSFPGAIQVDAVTTSTIELPLAGTYTWPVRPVEPYTFEIVPHGGSPRTPAVTIPLDEIQPAMMYGIREFVAAEEAEGLEATLIGYGFEPSIDVRGQTSLQGLRLGKQHNGVYVLHLTGDRYYVGQSKNVINRFAQHSQRYATIERFSFKPLPGNKATLDIQEQNTITILEDKGYQLLNIVHANITYQSSDFDLLITPEEQSAWLASDPLTLQTEDCARMTIDPAHRVKNEQKFAQLRRRRDASELMKVMRQFVQHCIPRPMCTEFMYWSVSCMPAFPRPEFQRIACFNMNKMEVFVINYDANTPYTIQAFINLSYDEFRKGYPTDAAFQHAFPGAVLRWVGYEAAGTDQYNVTVYGIDQIRAILRDPTVIRAVRVLAIHLMRKGTNVYRRYHSFDLADQLVN